MASVLIHFGLRNIRLLTNNPRKLAGLRANGVDVEDERLLIKPTLSSEPYLRTKDRKRGISYAIFVPPEETSELASIVRNPPARLFRSWD